MLAIAHESDLENVEEVVCRLSPNQNNGFYPQT